MNLYQEQKKLDDAGNEGVWIKFNDDVELLIGSMSAPKYQKVFEVAQKILRREYKARKVPDAVAQDAMIRCMSEGCFLGWRGMTNAAGEPLDYSSDNAAVVLKDLKRVRDFVAAFASDDDNFISSEDAQTKNS